jgi:hypothetical protein
VTAIVLSRNSNTPPTTTASSAPSLSVIWRTWMVASWNPILHASRFRPGRSETSTTATWPRPHDRRGGDADHESDVGSRTDRLAERDLIDLRETGVPLLRSVLRDGHTLLSRDRNARDRLVSRMLADVEDFLPLREHILRERRHRWMA